MLQMVRHIYKQAIVFFKSRATTVTPLQINTCISLDKKELLCEVWEEKNQCISS